MTNAQESTYYFRMKPQITLSAARHRSLAERLRERKVHSLLSRIGKRASDERYEPAAMCHLNARCPRPLMTLLVQLRLMPRQFLGKRKSTQIDVRGSGLTAKGNFLSVTDLSVTDLVTSGPP